MPDLGQRSLFVTWHWARSFRNFSRMMRLLLLLLLFPFVYSQCSCRPHTFSLTLDFANESPTTNRLGNYFLLSEQTAVYPSTPFASLSSLTFVEYNDKYELLERTVVMGDFGNGDMIPFVSKSRQPRYWEVYLVGSTTTATEDEISVHWAIDLGSCPNVPVMEEGQAIGITEFVRMRNTNCHLLTLDDRPR